MRILFSIAAGLTLLLGVGWLIFPATLFAWWDVQPDPVAVYMARRYGGLFFGYSALLWLARGAEASVARSAILVGGAVVTSVMTLVSLAGVLGGVVGPALWSAVGIEAVLTAGFWYYVFTARK
jgi:hypothetical protein